MNKMRLYSWFVFAGLVTAQAQTLLVLNKDEASLVYVDIASGKVTGKVPVGDGPHELVVSTDGKLAFASNYGSGPKPGNSISVIDVAAKKELRRLDVSPLSRPHGLYFHDGKLYFTAEANKIIGRYDPAANRIDWMMGTGQNSTHMVMVSADGGQIYTANISANSITILDRGANGNWNATVVPVGKGPEGIELSPDGKQLWTSQSQDGGVSVIDVASKKVVKTFDAKTQRSNRIKFTPDGKHILITDLAGGELVILDAATQREVKRLKLGKSPEGILMTPDGTRALIAVNGDSNIAVLDLKTLEVTGRIQPGPGPDGMAWAK